MSYIKKNSVIFSMFFAYFIFISCSKKEENAIPMLPSLNSGKLIVNNVQKPISKAYLIPNYTGNDPNYNKRRYYFILTNGDVSMTNNQIVYSDNITQLIDFNMYCSAQHEGSIESTTYQLNNTNTNVNYNNAFIDHSGINTNVILQNGNFISGNTLNSDDMTSGQSSVEVNGQIYTISFSFSDGTNIVSGTYTGTMTILNYQY